MLGSVRSLIVVGLLLLPSIALAADLEAGLAAYSEGDYETSLAECEPLAEDGDAGAQFCVGRLYANGFGVAMNDDLALKWYGLAAEQGHIEAQYSLGVMHANGWGVVMDDQAAVNWYRMAAEQGYIETQTSLAKSYQKGRGVEQNFVEAYTWFHIAILGAYPGPHKSRRCRGPATAQPLHDPLPFSLEKMRYAPDSGMVVYRSKPHATLKRKTTHAGHQMAAAVDEPHPRHV